MNDNGPQWVMSGGREMHLSDRLGRRPIDPNEAVGARSKVVARYSDGSVHGFGRVISYSIVPTFEIEREDGTRFSWRYDMVEEAPKWADLWGIDPDFTDGKPIDEWLDEQRGEA